MGASSPASSPTRALLLAGGLAAALTLAACGDAVEPGPLHGQDCLVIVLDALSAEHLGCYGGDPRTSPRLDALAAGGVRFERAWSQSSWTLASTASLFTGLYQETHAVDEKDRVLPEAAATLAEAFTERGYECLGFSQNLFASPTYGMGQGFARFETMVLDDTDKRDGAVAAAVVEALADPASRPPRFVYAHFRRPHAPYDPPAETLALFEPAPYDGPITGSPKDLQRHNSGRRPMGPDDLAHLRALYDAGIRAVDDEVGALLDGIDLQRTLVIVLSDHGDAFNQHGVLGHNFTSWEEMVRIPFLAAHPSLPAGHVSSTPAMSVDVVPTLDALFGLGFDTDELPGRSLAPQLMGWTDTAREIFTSSRARRPEQQFAVFDGRHKLLLTPDRRELLLFDLTEDPGEKRDLAPVRADERKRLRGALDRWLSSQTPMPGAAAGDLSEDQLEAMRELGYMGGKGGAVGHDGH